MPLNVIIITSTRWGVVAPCFGALCPMLNKWHETVYLWFTIQKLRPNFKQETITVCVYMHTSIMVMVGILECPGHVLQHIILVKALFQF